MKNITYVYGFGREKKLTNNKNFSADFLYGYDYFLNNNYEVDYITASKSTNTLLIFVEKVLRKLTKLPFYLSNYISWKNTKQLFSSKVLVLTNDTIALSLLPILIIHKLIKGGEIFVIIMGLLSKPKPNIYSKFLQSIIIKLLLKVCSKFIFLGRKEKELASTEYPNHLDKLAYVPFCIDSKFWRKEKIKKRYDIAFVGNDGNRDFKFLTELIESLDDLRFLVISSNEYLKKFFNNYKFDKVDFIEGSLSESELDDLELKKLYSSSKISIIPLKETFQPSGQSVSLQSLSTGLPIIITETHGNWFFGEEIDSKFLNVVKKNEINLWDKKIRSLLKENKFYENKSKEIEIFVSENLDKKKFDTALESFIFDEVSQN